MGTKKREVESAKPKHKNKRSSQWINSSQESLNRLQPENLFISSAFLANFKLDKYFHEDFF